MVIPIIVLHKVISQCRIIHEDLHLFNTLFRCYEFKIVFAVIKIAWHTVAKFFTDDSLCSSNQLTNSPPIRSNYT